MFGCSLFTGFRFEDTALRCQSSPFLNPIIVSSSGRICAVSLCYMGPIIKACSSCSCGKTFQSTELFFPFPLSERECINRIFLILGGAEGDYILLYACLGRKYFKQMHIVQSAVTQDIPWACCSRKKARQECVIFSCLLVRSLLAGPDCSNSALICS